MHFISVTSEKKIDKAHAYELRLDYLTQFQKGMDVNLAPFLLTLRSKRQGGLFEGSKENQERLLLDLLKQNPKWMDLEIDLRPSFIKKALRFFPHTQFILSYHFFSYDFRQVKILLSEMFKFKAWQYKVAVLCENSIQALSLLLLAKMHPKLSVICMGEKVSFARVLAPIFKSDLGFFSAEVKTAPGQLSLNELEGIYGFSKLNPKTEIFALIGSPVERSIGHKYHNQVFQSLALNAVYVKIPIEAGELSSFFKLAKRFNLRGLSATMPLKEKVLPFVDFLDEDAKKIGAINTLLFKKGKVYGTNTDGRGAMNALEKKCRVLGKKIAILGAGGSSKAIFYEAHKRGGDVTIYNRTLSRAREITEKAYLLSDFKGDADIVINTIPDFTLPLIKEGTFFMDLVYPSSHKWSLDHFISGEEMFLEQAKLQTEFWLA